MAGIFTALFTPLKRGNGLTNPIDYVKAEKMIDDLIDAGVSGLVPVGTTGQSATLSHPQHMEFIRFTLDYVNGRVPVIAGAGSNSTRESLEVIRAIRDEFGTIAVLCVTGYYNNPPQEGILRHFKTLSKEGGCPIVIYNVPSRTQSYLTPETIIELSTDPKIIGLKQAVDFCNQGFYRDDTIRVIEATKEQDFTVLTGEDDGFFEILKLGGSGGISATANIPEAAELFKKLYNSWKDGDASSAEKFQQELQDFVKVAFCCKNPIPLGALFHSPLYLPLVSLGDVQGGEELKKMVQDIISQKAISLQKYHD